METELTMYTNTQIHMSWDTETLVKRYDELRENEPFDNDDFCQFLRNEFVDWIRNSSDKELRREIIVTNHEGEEID
jgi:hypothetical protein